MAELVAVKCSMCGVKDMVPVPGKEGVDTGFMWCPNCDHERGDIRKTNSNYDGTGPTRGRGSNV